jgi:hypothetical protein|tara:strand:- start:1103 stop:1711 length:609 start_codon:yes stop_codon:yes gene_type:complete
MYVDLEDVAFWMDAVRNSENPYGVLESFWKGQLKSKVWLIENLKQCVNFDHPNHIVIHGGWNGVLASLLFNTKINIKHITNIDIDSETQDPASDICKRQEIEHRFLQVIQDMEHYIYSNTPDIVINTSTEHITQDKYDRWFKNIPKDSLIVLQSNNYYDLPEHVRCFNTVEDFAASSGLGYILVQDTLELPMYNRFLLIGRK